MPLFLYNKESIKKNSTPSLMDMALEVFGDNQELLECLSSYLSLRKNNKNLPSCSSWRVQLNLLHQLPDVVRIQQVKRATERGWRAIAFENQVVNQPTRVKFSGQLADECF